VKKLRAIALIALLGTTSIVTHAATEAERIQMLEDQLRQQKAVMRQQEEALRQQHEALSAMEEEITRLKSGQPAAVAATKPAPAATPRKESGLPAPKAVALQDTTVDAYGHIQLDAIYDFKRVAPDWEATLRPSTIPIEKGLYGADGNTIISVKQTAMGFRSTTDTPWGPFKTWFEFDFFGTGSEAGQTTFNLRHAWAEVGGLGFGQTNSNFMDISIFPNVVDWWGPSGMVFNRNPQVRYTWHRDNGEIAVALEKQNGSFNSGIFGDISPGFGEAATDRTAYPDFTAHWRSEHDWGHYQIAGVARKLEFETRGTTGNKPKDDDFGWGLNLTGVFNVFARDQLKLGLVHGEGIASFMNDGGVNLAPDNFKAKAVEVTGATVYYDRYWSDRWSSSIGYSINDTDPLDQMAPYEFQTGQYASTNLLYTPYPALLIGSEFLWGNLEDVAGNDRDDYRVQFTLKHKFDKSF
jgi:cell division protein FtsB